MIVEGIIKAFSALVKFIISLLPASPVVGQSFGGILEIFGYGLYFFGGVTFSIIIANILAWSIIDMTWVIVEWVYKKIPGVS